MRRGYRVKIAGEMQINIFHWHNLRITATRRAAFYAKTRTKAGFTQCYTSFFTEPSKRVCQTD